MNTAYNDVWNGWEKISSNIEEQIKNLNNTGIVVSKEEPQEAMIWFEVTD